MPIIFNEGSQQDIRSINLETRAGNYINNVQYPERPVDIWNDVRSMFAHLNTAVLMSETSVYNCMGMVFASRRTSIGIKDWLENILREDKYRKLDGIQDIHLGDIIVYRKGEEYSHVAVLIEKNMTVTSNEYIVLSQWGKDGEWKHNMNDVPFMLGRPSEYWTHRRSANEP